MRHRMVSGTGMGNPDPVLLDNQGSLPEVFAQEALEQYFPKEEGFDFKMTDDLVNIGIEPAYQYEQLKIISINKNKEDSYIMYGKAWGPYGSGIVRRVRHYKEYKHKSKFIRFIDKWHKEIFDAKFNKF